ncbi:hypothetical protein WN943_007483 [Citrus x changshan-huyou]
MAGGIKEKKQKLERGSWSDLPLEIINSIVSRLYVVYQIRFRAVCKRWRAADIQSRDKFPWLMGYNSHSCYLPGDTTWTELRFQDNYRYVKNLVCADGFLYCSFFSLEAIVAYNVASQNLEILPYPPSILFMYKYLTEYDGSLLIFGKVVDGSGYRVFTFNRSQMDWFEIESLDDRVLFTGASCLWVPVEKGSAFANTVHWFGRYSYIRDVCREFIRKPVESDSSKVAPRVRGYEYSKEEEEYMTQIWIQPPSKTKQILPVKSLDNDQNNNSLSTGPAKVAGRKIVLVYVDLENVVYVNGFLYCSFFSPTAICALNAASGKWEQLPYPPSCRLEKIRLIDLDDRERGEDLKAQYIVLWPVLIAVIYAVNSSGSLLKVAHEKLPQEFGIMKTGRIRACSAFGFGNP